jgi:hypothetical protein
VSRSISSKPEGYKRVLAKNALNKTIDRVVVSDARILGQLSSRTFASRLRGATRVAASPSWQSTSVQRHLSAA